MCNFDFYKNKHQLKRKYEMELALTNRDGITVKNDQK